jgi:hypothetical protein
VEPTNQWLQRSQRVTHLCGGLQRCDVHLWFGFAPDGTAGVSAAELSYANGYSAKRSNCAQATASCAVRFGTTATAETASTSPMTSRRRRIRGSGTSPWLRPLVMHTTYTWQAPCNMQRTTVGRKGRCEALCTALMVELAASLMPCARCCVPVITIAQTAPLAVRFSCRGVQY